MAFFERILLRYCCRFFALLCGWYKPWKLSLPFQPEEHPPKLSMIPLLVTLTAVTRVARRFFVN